VEIELAELNPVENPDPAEWLTDEEVMDPEVQAPWLTNWEYDISGKSSKTVLPNQWSMFFVCELL